MQVVTLSGKGQLVIPKSLRERLGLKAGSRLSATLRGSELRLNPVSAPPNEARVTAKAGLLHKPGRKKLSHAEEQRRIAALIAAGA